MSRTIKVTITDATLAKVRAYCKVADRKPRDIIHAQDWSETVNDIILQYCDRRFDFERGAGIYPSFDAARAAAWKFWQHQPPEWDRALELKYIEDGETKTAAFESPLPMPEDWLRMRPGGYIFAADMSQEEINRLVDKGVL